MDSTDLLQIDHMIRYCACTGAVTHVENSDDIVSSIIQESIGIGCSELVEFDNMTHNVFAELGHYCFIHRCHLPSVTNAQQHNTEGSSSATYIVTVF